jgi:hypothetical protein
MALHAARLKIDDEIFRRMALHAARLILENGYVK